MKRRHSEREREIPLSLVLNGKTFTGSRIIRGTSRLLQTICYGGTSKHDDHPYDPFARNEMERIAKFILTEILLALGEISSSEVPKSPRHRLAPQGTERHHLPVILEVDQASVSDNSETE